MTSLRQIKANRRNAQKSTGPRTESGKQRVSQNAVRHGLTAETVITPLEDIDDYQAFELAVTSDYDAETVVERELVLRLASLLWRLRRAIAIETGLFQIQAEISPESNPQRPSTPDCGIIPIFQGGRVWKDGKAGEMTPASPYPNGLDIARHFLRVANLDNGVFDRLGRYETALWRQVRQTIITLETLRWRVFSPSKWRTHDRWHGTLRAEVGSNE